MAAPALEQITTTTPYRFTVEQFYRMAEVGILREGDRVELIEGEIIAMAAIGPTHSWIVANCNRTVMPQLSADIRLDVQSPIHLSYRTEPQPDLCISRRLEQIAHPTPANIYLVIEIADTTLDYDRNTKLPLYAAAGIPEAWLFDVKARQLERHTEPRDGVYQRIAKAGRDQTLTSTTLPTLTLAVNDLLR